MTPKNLVASIQARLKNIAIRESTSYDRVLQHYFRERFLFRLAKSPYKNSLVLKDGLRLFSNFNTSAKVAVESNTFHAER